MFEPVCRRLALAFTLLATLTGAAGCGNDTGAATGGIRIAVIPKGTSHEFWRSVHAGAVKVGRERGVEVIWKGPAREDDRADQMNVVEDAITRGVDGILIAPLDSKALVGPLEDAAKNDIPVVVFDSDVEWDGRASFVATDNLEAGRLAGRHMGSVLEGAGKILVLRYQEQSASTTRREAGFLETMAQEFPDIGVVSSNQYGGATRESCTAKAEDLLTRFPDVDGVFGPCEPVTYALLKALRDAGKAGEVVLVGFDATEKMVEGLRQGQIHGLVVQNPFAMGERGLAALLDAIDGKAPDAFIDTGVVIATRENMSEPDIQNVLSPDLETWLGK